jgi:hypothetical protein
MFLSLLFSYSACCAWLLLLLFGRPSPRAGPTATEYEQTVYTPKAVCIISHWPFSGYEILRVCPHNSVFGHDWRVVLFRASFLSLSKLQLTLFVVVVVVLSPIDPYRL